MSKQQLFKKAVCLGICSIIGLSALGFGQAHTASAMVIGTAINANPTFLTASAIVLEPVAPETAAAAAKVATSKVDKLIDIGKNFLGVKYQFGAAAGSTLAFDCSSYTQYIFNKIGISLPRTSSAQATVGVKVAKSNLKAGDLVFFKRPGKSGIGHVGLYIGNGKMIGASGNAVQVSDMNTSYWTKNYVTARRVL